MKPECPGTFRFTYRIYIYGISRKDNKPLSYLNPSQPSPWFSDRLAMQVTPHSKSDAACCDGDDDDPWGSASLCSATSILSKTTEAAAAEEEAIWKARHGMSPWWVVDHGRCSAVRGAARAHEILHCTHGQSKEGDGRSGEEEGNGDLWHPLTCTLLERTEKAFSNNLGMEGDPSRSRVRNWWRKGQEPISERRSKPLTAQNWFLLMYLA